MTLEIVGSRRTLLSWCAKRGLPWEDRQVLGGHTSTVRSAMVYSRDSLGKPLRLLEILLHEVRLGLFLPDATRSGRYPGGRGTDISADVEVVSNFSYEPSLLDDHAPPGDFAADPEPDPLKEVQGVVNGVDHVEDRGPCKPEPSEFSWSLVSAGVCN